jgi:hypothetical protein
MRFSPLQTAARGDSQRYGSWPIRWHMRSCHRNLLNAPDHPQQMGSKRISTEVAMDATGARAELPFIERAREKLPASA